MRVLVVDDDLPTIELMRLTLASFGHSVVSATNVADALALMAADPPRVVFSDLTFAGDQQAGQSGSTFARSVRANPDNADVVMIAVTGSTSPRELQGALDSGFNEVITKPFGVQALIERLDEIGKASAPRSLGG